MGPFPLWASLSFFIPVSRLLYLFTMLACFLLLAALDRLVLESAALSEKKARGIMLGKVCPEHRKVHDCLFSRICHSGAPPGNFLVHLQSCPDLLRGLGTGASW